MDVLALLYYAVICGALSLVAPRLRTSPLRFGLGVVVGLAAAGVLPVIRRLLGLG